MSQKWTCVFGHVYSVHAADCLRPGGGLQPSTAAHSDSLRWSIKIEAQERRTMT